MSEITNTVTVSLEGYGEGGWGIGGWGGMVTQTITEFDPAPSLDPVALGLSRVARQYQASPKFLAYLTTLLDQVATCEALLQSLYMLPDIPTMTGANLDTIGRIVGVSRSIPTALQLTWFGFAGESDQAGFGELGKHGTGARFYELGEPTGTTTALSDLEYRLLLQAKILRNHSHGTCEDILAALLLLFGVTAANVDDFGGMALGLAVGRSLTAIEKAMITGLDILPRPACVLIGSITTFNPAAYFGFAGQNNALGFGELGVPGVGGVLAELIPIPPFASRTLEMRPNSQFVEAS